MRTSPVLAPLHAGSRQEYVSCVYSVGDGKAQRRCNITLDNFPNITDGGRVWLFALLVIPKTAVRLACGVLHSLILSVVPLCAYGPQTTVQLQGICFSHDCCSCT